MYIFDFSFSSSSRNMPKDMLCKKTKRRRLAEDVEEPNSTDSSMELDKSHIH